MVVAILYLAPGCMIGVSHIISEANTFECEEPLAPHGYITHGGGLPSYIDKSKCKSRLRKSGTWSTVATLLFLGPLFVVAQAFGG